LSFIVLYSPMSSLSRPSLCSFILLFFLFTHPAPPDIYTLSLHDALPIFPTYQWMFETDFPYHTFLRCPERLFVVFRPSDHRPFQDRKSTRLNSSHVSISYAVFCLKKKNKDHTNTNNNHNTNDDLYQ